MKLHQLRMAVAASVLAAGTAGAQNTAKDIVLDQVAAPIVASSSAPARGDAMVVSVLVEAPDGTLTPRSTEALFRVGERFRVKMLASREGRVALYNTTPAGVLKPEPVWRGQVKPGQETITPRLVLDGSSGAGVEQLHVVLEPADTSVVSNWIGRWFDKSASKDIRLDQQSTAQATYLASDQGSGLLTTVRLQQR